MERRDLYDSERNLTGETIGRGEKIPKGRFFVTVVIWIQNSNGEFLIQKRVPRKDGKWAATGGHPISGETSKEGILTEVKEELGLDLSKKEIILFNTIKTEDDFIDLYYLKDNVNINDIVIQEEEVEEVKWATEEEIKEMIKNKSFSSSHAEFFYECTRFIKNK